MEKQIPGFAGYTIDEYGTVRHTDSDGIIEPVLNRKGLEYHVVIKNDMWKIVKPKVSRLVMTTFHPVENIDYNWITAYYKNGDRFNFSLDNLEWEFEGYTPSVDALDPKNVDVFVTIPGYSNYEITPSGKVRNSKTKDLLTFSMSSSGYLCCRITTDLGRSTYAGLHRLLALAFLEHPTDVDQLVINHKDGVKTNNRIWNIEWSSYSNNITHAYYNDLRSEITPVYAKHAETSELKTFPSLNDAARFFGNSNPGKIHWWLHRGSKDKVREGWFVSLTNDWSIENMSHLTEM